MPRCKACGAPIKWIKTQGGKNMPVNIERVMIDLSSNKVDTTIITEDGIVMKGKEVARGSMIIQGARSGNGFVIGYESHFATCPAAGKFRRV